MGTQSGAKTIVYNTRERLISTDPNRAQAFAAQAAAELLRWMIDARADGDVAAGGVESLGTGTETPLRAWVLSGLRGRPEIGTTNLFVQPGALLAIDNPSPGTDDSIGSFLTDAGVQTAGVLTLTPNSSSTRVDVLECQRIANVVETDNRDIFNPATGLFSPAAVTKVQNSILTYRIRTGTPGGGFPGLSPGWLPLMVASVPSSATIWDAVTCWDVRPLVSDLIDAPFPISTSMPEVSRTRVQTDTTTSAGHQRVYGQIDAQIGAWRAGGRIQSDAGGYVDLSDAQLPEAGYVMPGSSAAPGFWNLWLVFPFGLPRWVRYSGPATSARQPQGLRGIPVLSNAAARWDGTPVSTGPALPSWTGLGGSASQTQAVMALSGYTAPATPTYPLAVVADGEAIFPSDPAFDCGSIFTGINPLAPTVASDFSTLTWTNAFRDGVTHPANAKAIYVAVGIQMTTAPLWTHISGDIVFQAYFHFQVSGPDGNMAHSQIAVPHLLQEFITRTNAGHASQFEPQWTRVVRVPLAPNLSNPTTPRQFTLVWNCELGAGLPALGVTLSNGEADVIGWEVGP
jgi:hypothetical protein